MKTPNDILIPEMAVLLKEGLEVTFKVKGNSMWPFYLDNKTSVTLKKESVKKHDVVLARYQDRFVLHRILKIKDNTLTLRGDGAILKEVITHDDIIGKVIAHTYKKQVLADNPYYKFKVY
ncbi:MAG: peptidase S41, partial [Tenericutes bacterium HGW-Tenericutes-8]